MMRDAGVDVDDTKANLWRVAPGAIAARHWIIEPDLSNAVPFLAAAVVTGGSVRLTGWPRVSTQPADAILSILEKLGSLCATVVRISKCRGPAPIRVSTWICTTSAS